MLVAAINSLNSDTFQEDLMTFLFYEKERSKMDILKQRIFNLFNWRNVVAVRKIIEKLFDADDSGLENGIVDYSPGAARPVELVIVRPNIEHNMLGLIIGRGGLDQLGATLWGQTELSCYDDSMHGIWGMSYKYNSRAIVFNERNLMRLWDVAHSGYNGGKDCTHVDWTDSDSVNQFHESVYEVNQPYEGVSMMVMSFETQTETPTWPSPIIFYDGNLANDRLPVDGEHVHNIKVEPFRVFDKSQYKDRYKCYYKKMPDFSRMHNPKLAGSASEENESVSSIFAFQGTMRIMEPNGHVTEITGNGHHGPDYVGVASVRAGKGMRAAPSASIQPVTVL